MKNLLKPYFQTCLVICLIGIATSGIAKPQPHGKPHHFDSEFFELVIQNSDNEIVQQLKQQWLELEKERLELDDLMLNSKRNQKKIKLAYEQYRKNRRALGAQIRQYIDSNPSVEQLVAEYRTTKRQEFRLLRKIFNPNNDSHFNKLLAVATPDQAKLLKENKIILNEIHRKIKQSTKNRNNPRGYFMHQKLKTLLGQQRIMVRDILENNPGLFGE